MQINAGQNTKNVQMTPVALVISNVVASAITQTGATISWDLSDYGTGQVEYGPTIAYGLFSAPENSFNFKHHDQVLSGLTPGTVYHFRVHSKNQADIETVSKDYTFMTAGSAPAPLQLTAYLSIFSCLNWPNTLPTFRYDQVDWVNFQGVRIVSATNPALMDHYQDPTFYQFDRLWPTLVANAHARGCKVAVSLYAGDEFVSIVDNPTTLAQLVANVWNLIMSGHAAGADGFDLDCESVTAETPLGNSRKDKFLQALYAAKPVGKQISHAATWIRTDINQVTAGLIDRIQVMCYDMYYPPATARKPQHSTLQDSIAGMQVWAAYPKSKVLMGVPAYGDDVAGTHFMWNEILANFGETPDQTDWYASSINVQPSRASELGGNPVPISGGRIWAPGINYTKSKVDWVKANGFGGVMMYDGGIDAAGDPRSILQAIYDESLV